MIERWEAHWYGPNGEVDVRHYQTAAGAWNRATAAPEGWWAQVVEVYAPSPPEPV